jgi:hypothetical protein
MVGLSSIGLFFASRMFIYMCNNEPLNKSVALIGVAIQKEKPFETLREALKCFDNVLAINPQDKNAAYFKTLLIQILTNRI